MTADTSEKTGQGKTTLRIEGAVAHVTFDRPRARNALTWAMYDGMAAACDDISGNPAIRVAVFRGAGGDAFVAGTDIDQFRAFESGDDGVDYEEKGGSYIANVDELGIPTIAVVEGWAVGGGLAIANACDFRIATPGSRFGAPIARTLGNCLSAANLRALTATFGLPLVKRMLLLADMPHAEELLTHGYLLAIVEPDDLDGYVAGLCEKLCGHAPVTMRVTKEALRRLGTDLTPSDEDLIRECYGSADFHHGVESFLAKTSPQWKGE